MNTASIIGSGIVTVALLLYSLGFIRERRKKLVTSPVLLFFTAGVTFDITATIFMIIGSGKMLTLHGFIGYSALLGMLADTIFLWRHYLREGGKINVGRPLHLYSGIAYTWWVMAYITGGLMVAISKMSA